MLIGGGGGRGTIPCPHCRRALALTWLCLLVSAEILSPLPLQLLGLGSGPCPTPRHWHKNLRAACVPRPPHCIANATEDVGSAKAFHTAFLLTTPKSCVCFSEVIHPPYAGRFLPFANIKCKT